MPREDIEFNFQEEKKVYKLIFLEGARLALRMLRCERNTKLSMSHMMLRSFAKITDMSSDNQNHRQVAPVACQCSLHSHSLFHLGAPARQVKI